MTRWRTSSVWSRLHIFTSAIAIRCFSGTANWRLRFSVNVEVSLATVSACLWLLEVFHLLKVPLHVP